MYQPLPMDDDKIAKKDTLIFLLGILISALVVSASIFLYFQYVQQEGLVISGERIVTATTAPVAAPSIDYKNLKIEVLNASGKSGVAGSFAKKLTGLGYSNVTTGNYGSIISGGILSMPDATSSAFEGDLKGIGFSTYKIQKSDSIQIILGK